MSSPVHLNAGRLVRLAKRSRIDRADLAAGRCLAASLDLATEARNLHGIDVELVKWHVEGDPHFVDHWAVLLDDANVIDPTRVQVDGKRLLVNPIDDYPINYTRRRTYPASLLIDAYAEQGRLKQSRLSNAFLWLCGARLLHFDLTKAWLTCDVVLGLSAANEGTAFLRRFAFEWLRRALEGRALRLLAALRDRPEVSARSTMQMDLEASDDVGPADSAAERAASTRPQAWRRP